jgi:outer membrane protein TolC
MRLAVVTIIALAASGRAAADDAAPVAVTLADVLAAVPKAPAAQVGGHEIAAANASIDAAGAWPAPALHFQTNRLTAHVVGGVTLPLPLFGTVGAARREAEARARATRSEVDLGLRDVRRRAVMAWLALARSDGELDAATKAAAQSAELERIARGRLDAGVGGEVDVIAARAAHARADLAVANAKRALEAASAALAGVVGWNPLRLLHADGALPGGDSPSLDALRGKLAAHPERTVAQRRIEAADATVDQIRSQRRPGLALEAQVSIDDPTTPGTDAMVGLSLDLPLFSRVGAHARSAQATAAAERARLAVTEAQLGSGLVASYRRWQAATEKLAALLRDVVPAQERAATLSAQAYREGARDLASALQADRDLAAVRAEVNAARTDVAAAWIELQVASGEEVGGAH